MNRISPILHKNNLPTPKTKNITKLCVINKYDFKICKLHNILIVKDSYNAAKNTNYVNCQLKIEIII